MAVVSSTRGFTTVARQFLVSAVAVIAMAVVRALLDPWVGSAPPFIFFTLPMIYAAWAYGFFAGLFATGVSMLVGWFLFVDPRYAWIKGNPDSATRMFLFGLVGAAISVLCARLRASERAVADTGRLFRTTFENAAVGMAHVALDGRWQRVNQRLCEILQYSREELLQLTFADITHPDDLEKDWSHARSLLAKFETSYSMEKRYRRKDNSYVWANLTVSLQSGADGTPEFFIAVIEDISSRKAAEEAIRVNLEQLQTTFDGMVEPAMLLDPDGNFLAINTAYLELFGFDTPPRSRADFLRDFEFSDAEGARLQPGGSAFERAIRGEIVRDMEMIARNRATGRTFHFRSSAAPISDGQGAVRAVIVTSHDITESKRAELALHRSNAVLRQFAYAAAHDLQEPLRNVALASEVLEQRFAGQWGAEADKLLRINVEGAQRMHQMTTDLLTYARIADADIQLAPVVDPNKVITHVSDLLRHAIEDAQAELRVDCLPKVRVYEAHLVQLLQNLISNSLKYRKQHVRPCIGISATEEGGFVTVTVEDNGIGFDPAYQERIFGLFTRLHTRREYPGSGIGLALCSRIVEQYGGRIWARSSPGHGARFAFTLPGAAHHTSDSATSITDDRG